MLEVDWFARAYGWTPDVILSQPRQIMSDLRALRAARQALGGDRG